MAEVNPDGKELRPKVGIGVLILNDKNEVLLGLRNSSHGAGEWSCPGGHMEFGEKIFETAKREVKEETDLEIEEFELISIFDELRYIKTDNKHLLNIGVLGKYKGGEVKVMEPSKCDKWEWFALEKMPENLFEATEAMIKNFKDKKIYQP